MRQMPKHLTVLGAIGLQAHLSVSLTLNSYLTRFCLLAKLRPHGV